jgi:hypothetical protein
MDADLKPAAKSTLDPDTSSLLAKIERERQVEKNQFKGIKTILVVLSAKAMVYDTESLRQKILQIYSDAAVFFLTTIGKPIGSISPGKVDLLIDFTGPGQRQGWFYALALKRRARIAVGRKAGLFRKDVYDRVVDEKSLINLSSELLNRERMVQREVLKLAGIPMALTGEVPKDRGKEIALELPPMKRL